MNKFAIYFMLSLYAIIPLGLVSGAFYALNRGNYAQAIMAVVGAGLFVIAGSAMAKSVFKKDD